MLPQLLVSAVLFTASALSAAVPADVSIHSIAATRGIDLAGPIPADATAVEGGFEFTAESDASIWVRAQIAGPDASALGKREPANIGIGLFRDNNCLGGGFWTDNVNYGTSYSTSAGARSIGISYRGIRDNEHLDFSTYSSTNPLHCGTYVYSAAPFTQPGCWNTQLVHCYRFWR